MAGVPPLLGFFSKQFVLYSAIQSGYYFMAIIGIIVSVISASYYLKIIRVLHSAPQPLPLTPNPLRVPEAGEGTFPSPLPEWKGGGAPSVGEVEATGQTEEVENKDSNKETVSSIFSTTNIHSFMISTLTLSILLFILKPSILLNSTQLLSLSLFYC
jgi:NADH-ubiquinone oxidoreductase chain 2